ncbi:metal-dependent transcriptional regulator [Allonocardiopsis opalescens]|uniref:DtxR family iron (Metal) dependent repressor n=1 Tax=Allonocardiopsis opalescens TaxID=1144618 RepID=A0A2T0QA05_9ACTN|nr:metal-dependent transcriptional regulator [Allonocardiopsis opalescens]PRY00640.1 DtxR family iron (metal) dependent repressor [Allonocardiopsis opalescens]
MTAHGLIDTTEMYLRTIFELEEEGIVPLRARIAERLQQSGPTVSQTVARMERDALLRVEGDRRLSLTDEGRRLATQVMRKHRLAECLLVDMIGLPWEDVHVEACRWEHVMSEAVERRIFKLLGEPTVCPYGNPIPGLEEFGADTEETSRPSSADSVAPMSVLATSTGIPVIIRRISEQVQGDAAAMLRLKQGGIQPGREVTLAASDDGVRVTCDERGDGAGTEFSGQIAAHVFVSRS